MGSAISSFVPSGDGLATLIEPGALFDAGVRTGNLDYVIDPLVNRGMRVIDWEDPCCR